MMSDVCYTPSRSGGVGGGKMYDGGTIGAIVKCVFPLFWRFFARARRLQKQVTPLTPLTPKSFAPYAPCAPFILEASRVCES